MELQTRIKEVTELKSILAEARKVDHIINYEFDYKKANKVAHHVYKRIIAFNHEHPNDTITDPKFSRKDNPYGLAAYRSVGKCTTDRIFGGDTMSLEYLGSGRRSDYLMEITDLIKPGIDIHEFIIKQQTCTADDIERANQYFKVSLVNIQNPLTVDPVRDIRNSYKLSDVISNVDKAKGDLVASKNAIKLHSKWHKFLQLPDSAHMDQINLDNKQTFYEQSLEDYKHETSIIKDLMSKARKYHKAAVLVKDQPTIGSQCPLLDLRPAEVSDLQKHTAKDSPFGKLYHNAMAVLNSIDYNDVDGSVNRIYRVISPIIKSCGVNSIGADNLGVRAVLVKNAVTQDIPYQRSRKVNHTYLPDHVFAKVKQNHIKQDQKILKRIQGAGKYLNSELKPYNKTSLRKLVHSLKRNLWMDLCRVNKNNENFNPQITVAQARIVIYQIFGDAVYARENHYKMRANNLIDWVANNHPHAKISYRQLNPVGHFIYKRNIKNIKKALA